MLNFLLMIFGEICQFRNNNNFAVTCVSPKANQKKWRQCPHKPAQTEHCELLLISYYLCTTICTPHCTAHTGMSKNSIVSVKFVDHKFVLF